VLTKSQVPARTVLHILRFFEMWPDSKCKRYSLPDNR